mmetsp:Transcript_20692/g.19713  ORF Transcript_20692/g.19713 Transcript_20692/m.19713 type:complete len:436 (-) Transcript_20692:159-1466(-)
MLSDKDFYFQVKNTLRERYIYLSSIWEYSFLHKDEQGIKEYLSRDENGFIQRHFSGDFSSTLLTVSCQDLNLRHLEYYPMINSRVHKMGEDNSNSLSLNVTFRNTYIQFLHRVALKKHFTEPEKLILVYYLQLQDRIQEAQALFRKIDLKFLEEALRMQYDYMDAYFDFFNGADDGFKIARTIVRKYEDYPVISWRMLFLEMLYQLNEYDGEADEDLQMDSNKLSEQQQKANYKKSIKKEPLLQAEVLDGKLDIELQNIHTIYIKFYLIDVEILFSRAPFLKEKTEEFSFVKPFQVLEEKVPEYQSLKHLQIAIPEELKKNNMVIEVNGEGKQLLKSYYSSQLKVVLIESFGELKVCDQNDQPLPKVYVKVFAQNNTTSDPIFFKDGYTDIRGKFEYAQVNGNKVKEVKKFAILVLSDSLGSTIKECDPPKVEAA